MFSPSKDMQVWQSFFEQGGTDHATILWKVKTIVFQSGISLSMGSVLLLFKRTLPMSVCVCVNFLSNLHIFIASCLFEFEYTPACMGLIGATKLTF